MKTGSRYLPPWFDSPIPQKIGQQRFILVHHGEPDAAQCAVVGMSAEHHADERGHRQWHDEIDEPRQRVAPGAAQVFGEEDTEHG